MTLTNKIPLVDMFMVRLSKANQPENYIEEIIVESICPTFALLKTIDKFKLLIMEFDLIIKVYDTYPKYGDITPLSISRLINGKLLSQYRRK